MGAARQLHKMTYPSGEEFSRHIGSTFLVTLDEGATIKLELGAVDQRAFPGGIVPASQRPGGSFSLIFLGDLEQPFEQRMYLIEHEVLGRMDIFLVPVGPNKSNQKLRYEAVFN